MVAPCIDDIKFFISSTSAHKLYRRFQCYGGICRHSTENVYNDT
jgi:hypothetical protein